MDTRNQSNKHIMRNLVIFTFLLIALPWLGRGLDSLMGSTPPQGIGMLIWIITPLGVSFLLRTFAGDGWKNLGIKPAIKGNVLWYAISILVYPICITLILGVGQALGAISFPDFSPDTAALFVQAFTVVIVQQSIKNIFEEFTFPGVPCTQGVYTWVERFRGTWGSWADLGDFDISRISELSRFTRRKV